MAIKTDSELGVYDLLVNTREQIEGLDTLENPELIAKVHELVNALQYLLGRSYVEPADPEVDELQPEEVPGGGEDDDPGDDFATIEEIAATVERSNACNTVYFVAEFGGSLRHFALISRSDGLLLYQNDRTTQLTADKVECEIGQVVWANLTAYKLGHGWRVSDVIAAVTSREVA